MTADSYTSPLQHISKFSEDECLTAVLVICPIAIAQHGTDYKITPVISVCLSLSVCLCVPALMVAIFNQFQ